MQLTLKGILKLLGITLCGLTGSVIVGLLVYGGGVFNPATPGFSYFAYGLSGGFIFAFYHVRGLSESITVAVVVSAIQFAIATTWITVLNAVIWSFGVNLLVILLAFVFERKLQTLRWAKFIVVGAAYASMFVMLTLIVAELTGVEEMPAVVFRQNAMDGFLIGLGLGLGVEAGEALVDSVSSHRAAKAEVG